MASGEFTTPLSASHSYAPLLPLSSRRLYTFLRARCRARHARSPVVESFRQSSSPLLNPESFAYPLLRPESESRVTRVTRVLSPPLAPSSLPALPRPSSLRVRAFDYTDEVHSHTWGALAWHPALLECGGVMDWGWHPAILLQSRHALRITLSTAAALCAISRHGHLCTFASHVWFGPALPGHTPIPCAGAVLSCWSCWG